MKTTAVVVLLLFGLFCVLVVGAFVVQRVSDGPAGPIPGGRLTTGVLASEPDVDWSAATGGEIGQQLSEPLLIEIQLVEPLSSRTTGVMLHAGQLFVPCDLGFGWGRFAGRKRWILNLIYVFKRWHEDAQMDGRAVVRIAGKRYERQAVRVTDPELVAALRLEFEDMVRRWVAPDVLGEAPTQGPSDIWFFRLDPRPAT